MKAQEKVNQFCSTHNLRCSLEHRALDLVSEVGEVAKEILKRDDYGKAERKEFGPEWTLELGDLFFSLCCLANQTDVDVEEALDQVLDKYRQRVEAGGSPSSTKT